MNPILWRLVILATIFTAGFGGGVGLSRNHYRAIIAETGQRYAQERQAMAEALNKALVDNEATNRKLEETHAKNTKYINDLFTGLANSSVQLPTTTCPSDTASTTDAASAVAATRLLRAEQQAGMDRAKQRLDTLAHEADTVVEDCRLLDKRAAP